MTIVTHEPGELVLIKRDDVFSWQGKTYKALENASPIDYPDGSKAVTVVCSGPDPLRRRPTILQSLYEVIPND